MYRLKGSPFSIVKVDPDMYAFYDRRIGVTHFAVDKPPPTTEWKIVKARKYESDVIEDLEDTDDERDKHEDDGAIDEESDGSLESCEDTTDEND